MVCSEEAIRECERAQFDYKHIANVSWEVWFRQELWVDRLASIFEDFFHPLVIALSICLALVVGTIPVVAQSQKISARFGNIAVFSDVPTSIWEGISVEEYSADHQSIAALEGLLKDGVIILAYRCPHSIIPQGGLRADNSARICTIVMNKGGVKYPSWIAALGRNDIFSV